MVERTFAWLSRCRRLARDYETRPQETRPQSSETLILLAMLRLMLILLAPSCLCKLILRKAAQETFNRRWQKLCGLHIETEVHDIAILHDVVFAFNAQFACFAGARLTF